MRLQYSRGGIGTPVFNRGISLLQKEVSCLHVRDTRAQRLIDAHRLSYGADLLVLMSFRPLVFHYLTLASATTVKKDVTNELYVYYSEMAQGGWIRNGRSGI